ncbi:hypothetical protein ncot_16055 [Nocardioides sp. JQ2195]|uniref:hypothetical protein n=1 Tax=Nocardioides sp. JQ2195 TaxID=2592334 RepID=UPI00143E8046|nr:hypothetical protein [Nocardioides sp. JQ2195]QIX27931.1 hypothetical protein ncot_16055 [Nocardioides sp. JQ2195]
MRSTTEAAWTTGTTIHDAKAQVCKVKRAEGWKIATVSVKVWAKRGRVSEIRSLRARKGDLVDTMVSERSGVGAGGGIPIRAVARC